MKRTVITVILTLAFTAFAIHAVEQTAFKGAGIIESTTGGFKFPDGSVQSTAIAPGCTEITYVPITISSSGVYCLTGNLETSEISGDAIYISADNVVIDLNGWTLDGSGGGISTDMIGINIFGGNNVTIRNGTIHGFHTAIDSFGSDSNLYEDLRIDMNTNRGLSLWGDYTIVRRNQIVNTGDQTGAAVDGQDAAAIHIRGAGVRVLNNEISNTYGVLSGQDAWAMYLQSADDAVIEGNRIDSVESFDRFPGGISINSSDDVIARGNSITSASTGIYFMSPSTGKYMDNLTSNVPTPFGGSGGIDAGGNN